MALRDRLMLLVHGLRHPQHKPPVTAEVDQRLDQVERRLDRVMTVDGANRAQRIVRTHR